MAGPVDNYITNLNITLQFNGLAERVERGESVPRDELVAAAATFEPREFNAYRDNIVEAIHEAGARALENIHQLEENEIPYAIAFTIAGQDNTENVARILGDRINSLFGAVYDAMTDADRARFPGDTGRDAFFARDFHRIDRMEILGRFFDANYATANPLRMIHAVVEHDTAIESIINEFRRGNLEDAFQQVRELPEQNRNAIFGATWNAMSDVQRGRFHGDNAGEQAFFAAAEVLPRAEIVRSIMAQPQEENLAAPAPVGDGLFDDDPEMQASIHHSLADPRALDEERQVRLAMERSIADLEQPVLPSHHVHRREAPQPTAPRVLEDRAIIEEQEIEFLRSSNADYARDNRELRAENLQLRDTIAQVQREANAAVEEASAEIEDLKRELQRKNAENPPLTDAQILALAKAKALKTRVFEPTEDSDEARAAADLRTIKQYRRNFERY